MQSNLLEANLIAHSPFVYFGITHVKQCLGVSAGLAALLDTNINDIEGIPLSHLVHKNDFATVNTVIDKCLNNAINDDTLRFRLSFYQRRWCYVEASIKRVNGDILGCYCIDISEQVRLQTYNDKMMRLISAAGDLAHLGYWQFNLDSNRLYWSDEIYKIHGVSSSDYVPDLDSALAFFVQDDLNNISNALNACIEHGTEWSLKAKLTQTNGEVRHILSSGFAHANEDTDRVDYITGVLQDITSLEIIQKERDLLSCAAKTTTAGMVITDSNRKVIWINESFETLTEYTLAEVKGHSLKAFLQGANSDPQTLQLISQSLDETKAISTEVLNYTKSGREYWNKLIITPIFKNNKLINFVGVQHDITPQIKAQQALISNNLELEEKVRDRTLALNKAIDELKKQATTDPLTGVLNRRALYTYVESIKLGQRSCDRLVWICVLDIDYFKMINDKYGHACGDQVLIQLSSLIQHRIRDTDRLFRVGGEEFVIILDSLDKDSAKCFIERLLTTIDTSSFHYKKENLHITVSIGMHQLKSEESFDKSFIIADNLLYQAKSKGRNRMELS